VERKQTGPEPAVVAGGSVLVLGLAVALFAPTLAPYDPALPSGPPLLPPGPAHPLGTNDIGQDILSEWLWGARVSLSVAMLVALLSTGLAWGVGIAAGLWRKAEGPLVAAADLLLALPSIPLYLLVVALVGPSQRNVVLTLGLLSWPAFARIVRAQVLALRGAPYVEAARALGATPLRVALLHVLPGTLGLLPAKLVLIVRFAIFTEATLAFLGLGDPAAKSWGTMLGWAFNYPLLFARGAWAWWVLPPAASIVLVVLATSWLATSLETASERKAHAWRSA
jgi:ABC-type dipeptide/oligopeptide/nickel transport system permease subunit